MSDRIVVVGSSNTDMIVQSSTLPRPGETVLGGRLSTALGGKGANQAVAAARAGGVVTLITCVGDDAFGQDALNGMLAEGIDVDHVRTDPAQPSGVALIMVDGQGENCISVATGANACLDPGYLSSMEAIIGAGAVVLAQLEIPIATVTRAGELARKHGVKFILNPAPAQVLDGALLRLCHVLTPNALEAERITGISITCPADGLRAAKQLVQQGVGTAIVTLGADGVCLAEKDTVLHLSGFEVAAIDTTAAGDCFSGALAARLAADQPMDEAVRFAQAAAALSVMKLGAQPSLPRKQAIEAFLETRQ